MTNYMVAVQRILKRIGGVIKLINPELRGVIKKLRTILY